MSRPPIRAAEYVKRRTVSRLGRRVGGSATVRTVLHPCTDTQTASALGAKMGLEDI